jgi:glucosamine kinase
MSESLVLGVDGGGSKTLMALATRDGTVTRILATDGINPLDAARWREPLDALFERLRGELHNLGGAALGMPGYGEVPHISAAQAAAVNGRLGCPHSLHNDVEMAFDGAFLGQPGVLILAGTGSNP